MIDRFDPLFSVLFCSVSLLIATAAFLFLEWRNQHRLLGWRMACIAGMMTAVAGLLLRPLTLQRQSEAVLLLTENYDPASVDSLLSSHDGMKILHLHGVDAYRNSSAVTSVNQLSRYQDRITHVAGAGLNAEARDAIGATRFGFIPAPFPHGIIELRLPREIYPHRTTSIEGVVNSETNNFKVVLSGPGGKEDSLVVNHSGIQPFKLQFTPKEPGNFLYEIHTGQQKEHIPLVVAPQVPMNVLMIQDYPTFEMRQLKSFLSGRHRLMVRSRISRDRFRYEYINREPGTDGRVTSDLLAAFDLLIVDSDAFENFSSRESDDVRKSVREGLGMVIIFNRNPRSIKGAGPLLGASFAAHRHDTAKVVMDGTTRSLPAWPVVPRFSATGHTVTGSSHRILSAFVSEGFGKIGFQLLQETYRLSLEGDSLAYGAVWSDLLEETARTRDDEVSITFETPFPLFENSPIAFQLRSGIGIPDIRYAGVQIPLMEDSRIDQVWRGKIWVEDPGWHNLSGEGDDGEFPFFVSERGSWQSLAMANNIKETQIKSTPGSHAGAQATALAPVSPWYFYILFLLCAGFLWLSPKL